MFLMAIPPVSPYLVFSDGMQRMWGRKWLNREKKGDEWWCWRHRKGCCWGCSGIVDLLEEEEREQTRGWYWTMSCKSTKQISLHVMSGMSKQSTTRKNQHVCGLVRFFMIPNDSFEEDFEKWYVAPVFVFHVPKMSIFGFHHCTRTNWCQKLMLITQPLGWKPRWRPFRCLPDIWKFEEFAKKDGRCSCRLLFSTN